MPGGGFGFPGAASGVGGTLVAPSGDATGATDAAAISAALAAAAVGGAVYLQGGLAPYIINTPIIKPAGKSLLNTGGFPIVRAAAAWANPGNQCLIDAYDTFTLTTAPDVGIYGIFLDGNGVANIGILSGNVSGNAQQKLWVERNTFSGFVQSGMQLGKLADRGSTSSDVIICRNSFDRPAGFASWNANSIYMLSYFGDWWFYDNSMEVTQGLYAIQSFGGGMIGPQNHISRGSLGQLNLVDGLKYDIVDNWFDNAADGVPQLLIKTDATGGISSVNVVANRFNGSGMTTDNLTVPIQLDGTVGGANSITFVNIDANDIFGKSAAVGFKSMMDNNGLNAASFFKVTNNIARFVNAMWTRTSGAHGIPPDVRIGNMLRAATAAGGLTSGVTYLSENSGAIAIAASTTAVFPHLLAGIPATFQATARNGVAPASIVADATNVTVTFGAAQTTTVDFSASL